MAALAPGGTAERAAGRRLRLPPLRWLVAAFLLLAPLLATAADGCVQLAQRQSDPMVATRLAAVACDEHLRWNQPFIASDGHLASQSSYEAEARGLADGGAPWRRVAWYWKGAELLGAMGARQGADDCAIAAMSLSWPGYACRGFVIDSPWSAAFISWVAQRAGVPGFRRSASHVDYVRAARRDPAGSPYRLAEPFSTTPAVGDMLCYVRGANVIGFDGLLKVLDAAGGLPMHCDIFVSVGAGQARLIGGNVQQAVTMRVLDLNAQGLLWGLPRRGDGAQACSPDAPATCSFNRQDWAALLKLKSQDELARIGPVAPPVLVPGPAAPPTCCVACVVGSGIPRCPADGQPVVPSPQDAATGTD